MNFKYFFFPKKYTFPDTKFNKNISVLAYFNSAFLMVDGLIESGDIMTQVWRKAIKALLPKSFKPKTILLLGLAGGCNAHLANHYFPESKITGVEVDPFMIELGKKYFRLGKVKNLKIVIEDAISFVDKLKNEDKFDLVMIDCFVGKEIPKKLEDIVFLTKLKKHSRYVLINRLWWHDSKLDTLRFMRSIISHFFFIKTHTRSNVIISLV